MEYVVVCGEDEVAGPPEIFVTHYEDAMTATFCFISTGVVYLNVLAQMGGTARAARLLNRVSSGRVVLPKVSGSPRKSASAASIKDSRTCQQSPFGPGGGGNLYMSSSSVKEMELVPIRQNIGNSAFK